ncbi:MAG: hypothetical protein NVSMB65_08700 [Chloroflexota bacterium]
MVATTHPLFCRTCQRLRLVWAQVRTWHRPFISQDEATKLVYVCRTCGATLLSTPVPS